jgi:uncharacterized membrane protein YgcG
VAAGDAFSPGQRHEIDKAIREAEQQCRLELSVYVGRSEGATRAFAERLHAALVTPPSSVLVLVDPAAKVIEIVTGERARRVLDDEQVALTVLDMQTAFAAGDLVGGIVRGVHRLAEHAQRPPLRHQH